MNSFLKYTVLTAVVLFVDGVWAQETKPAESSTTSTASSASAGECNFHEIRISEAERNKLPASEIAALQARLDTCRSREDRKRQDTKASCDRLKTELKDVIKDFPASSMQDAINCFSAEEDGDSSGGTMVKSVAYAAIGQNLPGKRECRLGGTKSNFAEQLKEKDKQIEEFEKEITKKDEDLIKETEDLDKTLKRIEDERLDIQEQFQKLQEKAEDEQEKALRTTQENQDKLSRDIRELNSQLLKARMEQQTLNTKLQAELQAKQVNSEASIQRTCEVGIQEYYDKRYGVKSGKKNAKAGSLGTAGSRGSKKKNDLKAAFNDCLAAQRKIRASIYEAAEQTAVLVADTISKMEADIAQRESDYKKQVEQYNTLLEKMNSRLTKKQQELLNKDQKLANDAVKAQQINQQKQARLNQYKTLLQQKLTAAHTTNGQLSEKEVEEGVEKYQEYIRINEDLESAGCQKAPTQMQQKRRIENKEKIESGYSNKSST